MNHRKTATAAFGAVVLVALAAGCAGVRSPEPGAAQANLSESQFVDTSRRDAAQLRADAIQRRIQAQATLTNEAIRAAKQAEPRTQVAPSSVSQVAEAVRLAKQAEARAAASGSVSSVAEAVRAAKQAESEGVTGPAAAVTEAVRAAKQAESQGE